MKTFLRLCFIHNPLPLKPILASPLPPAYLKSTARLSPLLPHLTHGPVIRSPLNRFSQHSRFSASLSNTHQNLDTRSMVCKQQDNVCLPFLTVIFVLPFPGLKSPNTVAGSRPAFTIDWKQSLATLSTVPRKQLGRLATLAGLRCGPGKHEWFINTWTV